MAPSSIQSSIAIIVFSFSAAFLVYYLLNDLAKEKRKAYLEEVLGQLINFVIYIWIGKVILKFSIFIKDPLAVLAYPSNSNAFYLAVLFSVITLKVQSKRGKIDILPFITAFIQIFLTATLVYEFVEVVWNNNTYSFGYLGLVALLVITLIVMRDFVSPHWLNLLIFLGWSIGSLGLALMMPIMMVFGYTVAPWFIGLMLLICCVLIVYQKKKEGVISGRN